MAEWTNTQLPMAPIQAKLWIMYLYRWLMKMRAGAGQLFISPLGVQLRYIMCSHYAASNNMAEYKALVNYLCIAIELGVRRLNIRGDSQLIIDQVMKNSSCHDARMKAYCKEVRRLEHKWNLTTSHNVIAWLLTNWRRLPQGKLGFPRTYFPRISTNPPL
jgi:ribonuclease HI